MKVKHAVAIVTLAAIAISGVFLASVFVLPSGQQTEQAEATIGTNDDQRINIATQAIDAKSYVAETGKSAVQAEWAVKEVSVTRGEQVNVQAVVKHLGGANAAESVNVKILPPTGYVLYPSSVAQSTTIDERVKAAQEGTVISGGVDLGQLVAVVGPNEKAVAKADEQAFQVTISIPKDFPDELLGEFDMPLLVEATDSSGNTVPAEASGITVVVSS